LTAKLTWHQKLTVVRSSASTLCEISGQTSGINGSDKGAEITKTGGGLDNVLTGCEGGRTQEGCCGGFEELHFKMLIVLNQIRQQYDSALSTSLMGEDETTEAN
jgi:hypothetical protein